LWNAQSVQLALSQNDEQYSVVGVGAGVGVGVGVVGLVGLVGVVGLGVVVGDGLAVGVGEGVGVGVMSSSLQSPSVNLPEPPLMWSMQTS